MQRVDLFEVANSNVLFDMISLVRPLGLTRLSSSGMWSVVDYVSYGGCKVVEDEAGGTVAIDANSTNKGTIDVE